MKSYINEYREYFSHAYSLLNFYDKIIDEYSLCDVDSFLDHVEKICGFSFWSVKRKLFIRASADSEILSNYARDLYKNAKSRSISRYLVTLLIEQSNSRIDHLDYRHRRAADLDGFLPNIVKILKSIVFDVTPNDLDTDTITRWYHFPLMDQAAFLRHCGIDVLPNDNFKQINFDRKARQSELSDYSAFKISSRLSDEISRYKYKRSNLNNLIHSAEDLFYLYPESKSGRHAIYHLNRIRSQIRSNYDCPCQPAFMEKIPELSNFYGKYEKEFLEIDTRFEALMGRNGNGLSKIILSRFCEIIVDRDPDIELIPFRDFFDRKRWYYFKNFSDEIDLSICLHESQKVLDHYTVRSNLRISIEEYLRSQKFDKPSEFADSMLSKSNSTSNKKIVYFLSEVCSVSNIEMIGAVEPRTNAILEERRKICVSLSELDPENSEEYLDEIKDISTVLELAKAEGVVHSTRIYIDFEQIRFRNEQILKSLFNDYVHCLHHFDFLSDSNLIVHSLDPDVIRHTSESQPARILNAGESERMRALTHLIINMHHAFSFDPLYGLDTYLSLRVRHGTISNTLRSPLIEDGFLTGSKTTLGSERGSAFFDDPEFGQILEPELGDIFQVFSAAIDQLISEFVLNKLQIQRPDKPDGLINIAILVPYLRRVDADFRVSRPDFDDAFDSISSDYLIVLSQSLIVLREYVTGALWDAMNSELINFQRSIERLVQSRGCNRGHIDFFRNKVQRTRIELRNTFDKVSSWFIYNTPQQNWFTLEQVLNVAINNACSIINDFDPVIESKFDKTVYLDSATLMSACDALFIIIENCAKHSELREPHIGIEAHVEREDRRAGWVVVSVSSEIGPKCNLPGLSSRIAEITRDLDAGNFVDAQFIEGGTGLKKLFKIVTDHGGSRKDFDVRLDEGSAFSVYFRIGISIREKHE